MIGEGPMTCACPFDYHDDKDGPCERAVTYACARCGLGICYPCSDPEYGSKPEDRRRLCMTCSDKEFDDE